MKLYREVLKGMTYDTGGGVTHGDVFVVADGTDEAYKKVRDYVDLKELGFYSERELNRIELLAEEGDYPNCGKHLFL